MWPSQHLNQTTRVALLCFSGRREVAALGKINNKNIWKQQEVSDLKIRSKCGPVIIESRNSYYRVVSSESDLCSTFVVAVFTGAKLDGLTRSLTHPRLRTSEAVSNQGSVRAVAVWIELNVMMEYHVTNISSVMPAVQRPPGHVGNVREVWKNGADGPTHKRGHFRMG